jgi:uncharacterized membrane protein YhaH (DUF805 family)
LGILSFKGRLNRAEYAIVFVGYLLLLTMFFLTESSTRSNGYRIRKVTKVTADTLEELSKILDGVNAGFCRLFVSSMQLCLQTIPYKSFDERTAVRGAC